jgi:radical SAM protein with 4Fe4S-binding SPASM domain
MKLILREKLEHKIIKLLGQTTALLLRQPRLAYHIPFNIRSTKALYWELLNLSNCVLGRTVSYRLRSIIVEPTNTCNLQCLTCPVNVNLKREKGFMDFALFKKIVDDNPQLDFLHLTFAGEPLLHPNLIDMISYAKSMGIRVGLVTNATLLNESVTQQLLDSELDIITFSVDGVDNTFERVRGVNYEFIEGKVLNFIEAGKTQRNPVKTEVSMVLFQETLSEVESFQKRWRGKVDWVNIQPQIGFEKNSRNRRCRNLWRTLAVYWDGRVVPCCVDYEGALVLGDARQESLSSIFNGARVKALRQRHAASHFDSICQHCSPFFG